MLSRRYLLLGALVVPLTAHAQNWPAGNIKIVVMYPPGGSTDMIARLIQPHMQQRLGTTVIIENRAGGGGSIGTAAVAKSSPDGSTWAMVFDNHAANPFVFPNMPFNTEKDLDPVQLIGTAPYVLSTNAQKPFKTLAEVVAAAKTKPSTISYATVGAGSVGHLAMELLWKQAGVRLVHVPYRGGGPAMNDLIAGHVDLLIASTAQSVPFIQAGSIRALAQSGKTRTSTLANVPAIAESYPDFEAYAWWGVFARAGTPKAIVSRFADELAASLREPGVAKQLNETQQVTFALGGPEELRKFVSEQMRLWGPVAREHNIQAD
ncbi:MAG: tripartite tricarboxylate transporter substrate binding protein [Pseudolabrys sp.]